MVGSRCGPAPLQHNTILTSTKYIMDLSRCAPAGALAPAGPFMTILRRSVIRQTRVHVHTRKRACSRKEHGVVISPFRPAGDPLTNLEALASGRMSEIAWCETLYMYCPDRSIAVLLSRLLLTLCFYSNNLPFESGLDLDCDGPLIHRIGPDTTSAKFLGPFRV